MNKPIRITDRSHEIRIELDWRDLHPSEPRTIEGTVFVSINNAGEIGTAAHCGLPPKGVKALKLALDLAEYIADCKED